jgi:asparagine synthase (glutamine-hydrolysing)
MCGIAGIFHVDPATAVVSTDVERMTASLQHRGPDEGSVYVDGAVGLGHRRLSIIDVAGGQQPMFNEDGTKAIIFNGEVYNYALLRDRLAARGHRFATRSDTEVILHAYEEYGEDCVQHLRGMFAFAIWDAPQRQIFLARDRLGIKPLYYCWDGRTLLFASELKAILQHPGVSKAIDPLALDDYLTYLYIPSPKTIFRGIRKLRPAHTLTVSLDGVQERQYWDVDFTPREGLSEAEYAAGLMDKLREAVALHLMSEVPLGAFLSGGVDSSAVVGLMAEASDKPVNTASIGFREAGFDELPYARMVARHFGAQAYEKIVEADAAKILDTLVWHFDEPFADASMVPTYYVSQVAR